MRDKRFYIRIAVALAALLTALSPVFFLGLRGSYYYHYEQPDQMIPEPGCAETLMLSPERVATQYFIPQKHHLASLFYYIVAIPGNPGDAVLRAEIKDPGGALLWSSQKKLTDIGNAVISEEKVRVKGDPLRVTPGQVYSLSLSVTGCPGDEFPSLVITDDPGTVPGLMGFSKDTGALLDPEKNIYMGYGYPREASPWVVFFSFALCLTLSFMLIRYFVLEGSFSFPAGARNVFSALILILWFLMSVPDIVNRLLGVNLDPSWRWFLNIAHEKGYVFGRDVFFSYGPLGFVYYLMNVENPGTYVAGLVIWAGLFLLHAWLLIRVYKAVKECRISAMALFLAFLFYACSFHESWTDNYILYLTALSLVLYDRGDKKAAVPLNLLLCFSFFGKITGFIGGFAMTTIYAVMRAITDKGPAKDRLKILFLHLPSAVMMIALFMVYSRSLSALSGYLYNIYDNVSGFNQTQQMNDAYSPMDFRCFFTILAFYLLILAIFFLRDRRRSALTLALGMPLFSAYKYGVTAHGMECSAWIAVMPLSAFFLTLPLWGKPEEDREHDMGKGLIFAVSLSAVVISVVFSLCSHGSLEDIKNNIRAKAYTVSHLGESTNDPALYTDYPLPEKILNETRGHSVGIYPWNLAYGAEYTDMDLRFSPPVYDGEEVYNPWLDRLSAEYYRERGPEYIILQ
ncbi:MAG: hypothetical protein K6E33_08530, partial [Lachnospiraceae bacterium]|nr:hypothetical protein [Lachnospiraceae bacterium]